MTGASGFAVVDPELPVAVTCQRSPDMGINLSWPAVTGQKYRVERSPDLGITAPWQPLTEDMEATQETMSYNDLSPAPTAPDADSRMFYRLAVSGEDFDPASLQPLWQLDAEKDFPSSADGQPVSQWTGAGIATTVQPATGRRPILKGGGVAFDGVDDQLSIPMWSQGVGTQWTLAVLLKVRKDIQDYRMPFGGDFAANRALELFYLNTGLMRAFPSWDIVVNQENYAFSGNDQWKILIIRSDGAQTKVKLDWYDGTASTISSTTGATGYFNLGGSYDPVLTAAPVKIRYMTYLPRCISDEETARLSRWMERKKNNEYPPVMLLYGGGQSNFLTTMHDLRKETIARFDNVALAFGGIYGGRPLTMWESDKEDGTGYEICPNYDLSAAPPTSGAGYQLLTHSGYPVIADWQARESVVKKSPKTLVACFFIQGESDTADARITWKPNGRGDYNLTYTDPDALAKTYGPRAAAWNAAVREKTGHPDMFFIYERLCFDNPQANQGPYDIERAHMARKSQLDALRNDPRWLQIDVADLPRQDGIHLTRMEYSPEQIPNTGAERFARSAARLLKQAERLSQLPYDARMMAMRLIDSGLEMDESRFQACLTFAAAPGYEDLRSLIIPSLTGGANAVEQSSLRRCNLLIQLGGMHPVPFASSLLANTTAICTTSADQDLLKTAITTFVTALGGSGNVDLTVAAGE